MSATDAADNKCTTNVTVQVVNENDFPPIFIAEFEQVYIPEETFPYTLPNFPENFLACFAVTDQNGDNITYFLPFPSLLFELSAEHEGCILLNGFLDVTIRHEVEISATDGKHNVSSFLIVDVENRNDKQISDLNSNK